MKTSFNHFIIPSFLVAVMLTMTSCWTSIWTVAPTTEPVAPVQTVYTTQVTTPTPTKHTTVTTVTVTNYNTDMCFYLDLNAVAAAFAESRSIGEFEQILNSSRYMINNLDLNRDGWVDYLRVIETRNGYYHALLIQACLAPGVFQDVATLVAERRSDRLYVEVIGDRYLYGYNYIVRPVFVKRPPMWNVYGQTSYAVWSSPYYYGYYPSYYTQPKPVYLNHYQAYVNTYMTNHHYCHHCDYPDHVFYNGYSSMTQPHHRNDYYNEHPEQTFERRVTNTISASQTGGVSVRNAGQLRNTVSAKKEEKPASTTTNATTGSTRTNSSTTGTKTYSSTRSTQPSTSVETRVKSSGTTRTTIKTTDSTGRTTTVKRESSNTTRQSNSSTRQSGTSTRSSQGSSSSQRTSGSTPRTSQPSR